jgi:hypothetical protein
MPPGWRLVRPDKPEIERAQTDFTDGSRVLQMLVDIDRKTQDIVVQISGGGSEEGLVGAGWGIQGMDLEKGRLVVPANGGCMWEQSSPITRCQFDYPREWEAGLVIWETGTGGFVVYTRDNQAHHKRLTVARTRNRLEMSLETHAFGPHASNTQLPDMFWRINTFKGDWRVPSDGYRGLVEYLRPTVTGQGLRAWTRSVRSVVTIAQRNPDPSLPLRLAERLKPAETVLYLLDWRKDTFGVHLPDYAPSDAAKEFIRLAKLIGYRVMLHMDAMAVSPDHPAAGTLSRYQLNAAETTRRPVRDAVFLLPMPPGTLHISPASINWRDTLLREMEPLVRDLEIDAVMLGGAGDMVNDSNPRRFELRTVQGMERLQRDILIRFPSLAVGADGLNEWLLPHSSLVMPRFSGPLPPHPVSMFLFRGTAYAFQHAALQPGFAEAGMAYDADSRCLTTGAALSPLLWNAGDAVTPAARNRFAFEERRAAEREGLICTYSDASPNRLVFAGRSGVLTERRWSEGTMRQTSGGEVRLVWSRGETVLKEELAALDVVGRDADGYGPPVQGGVLRMIAGTRPQSTRRIPPSAIFLPLWSGWTAEVRPEALQTVSTPLQTLPEASALEADIFGTRMWMDFSTQLGSPQFALAVPPALTEPNREILLMLPAHLGLRWLGAAAAESGSGRLRLLLNGRPMWECVVGPTSIPFDIDVSEFAGRRVRVGFEWDGPSVLRMFGPRSAVQAGGRSVSVPEGTRILSQVDGAVLWLGADPPTPDQSTFGISDLEWTMVMHTQGELLTAFRQDKRASTANIETVQVPPRGEAVYRTLLRLPDTAKTLSVSAEGLGLKLGMRLAGGGESSVRDAGRLTLDVSKAAGKLVVVELTASAAIPALGLTAKWGRLELR